DTISGGDGNHRLISGADADLLPLSEPIVLAQGASFSFTLEDVTLPQQNADTTFLNTVTSDAGTPAITLVKSVDANGDGEFNDSESVAAGTAGQTVDYQYVITNTSPAGAQDPLTIDSFSDVTLGIDLLNDSVVTLVISGGDADPLLEIGETWIYTVNNVIVPTQNAGTTFINTATVNATDDEFTAATDTDTATVTYTDVDPAITVAKTVAPGTVQEGGVDGQTVTYTYVLTNTSAASTDPLTIISLSDNQAGDILEDGIFVGGDANVNGLLDQGESWTYTIDELVAVGNVGDTHSNTATVNATDDEFTAATDTDTATVTYTDVDPAITVAKTVAPGTVQEGGVDGQTVTYTYVLTNTSAASTDPLTIISLSDNQAG
ncbi:MAG: hypothetical protein AABY47_08295, partial [Pseudomonadota bacterium]